MKYQVEIINMRCTLFKYYISYLSFLYTFHWTALKADRVLFTIPHKYHWDEIKSSHGSTQYAAKTILETNWLESIYYLILIRDKWVICWDIARERLAVEETLLIILSFP